MVSVVSTVTGFNEVILYGQLVSCDRQNYIIFVCIKAYVMILFIFLRSFVLRFICVCEAVSCGTVIRSILCYNDCYMCAAYKAIRQSLAIHTGYALWRGGVWREDGAEVREVAGGS